MFCRQCGKELKEGSKFCPNCGTAVRTAEEPAESTNAEIIKTDNADKAVPANTAENIVQETAPAASEVSAASENAAKSEPTPTVNEVSAASDNTAKTEPSKDSSVKIEKETAPKIKQPKQPKPPKEKVKKERKEISFPIKKTAILSGVILAVGVMGFWLMPQYLDSKLLELGADITSKPQENVMLKIAAGCDENAVDKAKLSLARSYSAKEELGSSSALLEKLAFKGNESAAEDIDAVFEENCQKLIDNSLADYAVVQAGYISKAETSNKMKNEAYIAAAKAAFDKNDLVSTENYINKVNTNNTYNEDAYNDITYKFAAAEFDAGENKKAYDAFEKIKNYSDSAEYIKKAAYAMGVKDLQDKQYTSALNYFEKAGGYQDSANKIKECQYLIAVKFYNEKNYDSARTWFNKVKGYKDTNTYLDKISRSLKYEGWYIYAYTCDEYYYAKTDFSSYDEFGLIDIQYKCNKK